MTSKSTPPQTAVWYFIGATFAFIAPTLLLRDAGSPWFAILTLILGIALLAIGIVVFVREQKGRRGTQDDSDPR